MERELELASVWIERLKREVIITKSSLQKEMKKNKYLKREVNILRAKYTKSEEKAQLRKTKLRKMHRSLKAEEKRNRKLEQSNEKHKLELSNVHASYKFKLQRGGFKNFGFGVFGGGGGNKGYQQLAKGEGNANTEALQTQLTHVKTEVKFWKSKYEQEKEKVKSLQKLGSKGGRADLLDKYQEAQLKCKTLQRKLRDLQKQIDTKENVECARCKQRANDPNLKDRNRALQGEVTKLSSSVVEWRRKAISANADLQYVLARPITSNLETRLGLGNLPRNGLKSQSGVSALTPGYNVGGAAYH